MGGQCKLVGAYWRSGCHTNLRIGPAMLPADMFLLFLLLCIARGIAFEGHHGGGYGHISHGHKSHGYKGYGHRSHGYGHDDHKGYGHKSHGYGHDDHKGYGHKSHKSHGYGHDD